MKYFFPLLTPLEASAAAERRTTVLLPIGTIEENGPHLPLGNDYLVAEAVARDVAERTESLWLPALAYGVSEILSAFPGTISVTAGTLQGQVESILSALVSHGFDHIIVVNNHTQNLGPIAEACRSIRERTGLLVPAIYPARVAVDVGAPLFAEESGTMGHGAEPSTSLMLHLFPNDVRMNLAQPSTAKRLGGLDAAGLTDVRFGKSTVNFFLRLEDLTETGSWADPTKATAHKGEALYASIVDYVASFVEWFRKFDSHLPHAPTGSLSKAGAQFPTKPSR